MGSIINSVKLKTQETFGNYKISAHLEYLRKSQQFKKEDIHKIQHEKLRKLINYSVNNIKFYSTFFKENNLTPADIKTLEDLNKLPIMTKSDYKKGFPNIFVDINAHKDDLYLNTTSGSTGAPFKFYMSKNHRGNTAARFIRYYEWTGRNYGEFMIKIWGSLHLDIKIKIFHKFLENIFIINAFDLTEETFHNYYNKIKKKNIKLLEAYTSGAYAFALLLKKYDLNLSIPATILSGETVFDIQKNFIEEQFTTEIYNRYGSREFGAIAQECSEHTGLHISQEDFIVEILDENNEPVDDGKSGNIFITSLDNLSMPFIRYKIEDRGAILTDTCPCGRELKMFKQIEGRISDIINSPSGRHISLFYFALVFQVLSDYVKEFQVQQKTNSNELILKIIPTINYNNKIERDIINQIKRMDDSFEIFIELVDNIPLETTGKKKYLKLI